MRGRFSHVAAAGVMAAALFASSSAMAQKKDDPGASDTEIKIGNMGPDSGPNSIASSWSSAPKVARRCRSTTRILRLRRFRGRGIVKRRCRFRSLPVPSRRR